MRMIQVEDVIAAVHRQLALAGTPLEIERVDLSSS